MSRFTLACAATLMALGLLTACGDDSSGGGATPTPEGTSSASPQLPGSGTDAPGAPEGESTSADDGPTVPLPTTTVKGTDAPYCQAALEAGLAADIQSLRSSITVLATSLPSRADKEVVEGLELLRDLYADADDLASAGEVYADASKSEQAKMDTYFAFQSKTCD
ncbi:hypothetical protein BJ980_002427 [Nocardioides daedukensis]|uniref:DUF732 domain-containing protein n=1 Tax=Nocardioides daedukensis TaxID=634462 RepID=A0A7Y9UTY6_9ACTN|nr:hypothetical protein [Nocardioides daedukensis]NYG59504.1 hypothetical protein [Nocardioides daedukensis]